MAGNRSAPPGTIVPSLIYNDVAKAIDWLCDVFGFKERLRIGGADGKIGHAQLAIGQGGVLLGAARTDQGVKFQPPNPNEVNLTLSIHVDDVDRHHDYAKQRGARILSPPTTYPYGERQYTAADLEGYRWSFSQTVADTDPSEWGAKASNIQGITGLLPRPRVCYLQIPSTNIPESVAFYEKVFGWNIRGRDTSHPSFDDASGIVSGSWTTELKPAATSGLLPCIWVDNIEATLAQAKASGGKVLESSHHDSPSGDASIATFRDPSGNAIGLYQEHAN